MIDSSTLHERAKMAGSEGRRLMIGLSTACLGMYFIMLSREIKPPLDVIEKNITALSVVAFSLAIFSGIFAWRADGKRYYFWAKYIDEKDVDRKQYFLKSKDFWYLSRKKADSFFNISFTIGILLSSIFLVLRIYY